MLPGNRNRELEDKQPAQHEIQAIEQPQKNHDLDQKALIISPTIKNSKIGSDTPLHAILRECHYAYEVKALIDKFPDKKALADMAKTVNDQGELPIFMVYSSPASFKEQRAIQDLLIPLSVPNESSFEEIDEKAILDRYSKLKEQPIYSNLKLGVEAIQAARKLFIGSGTHPEMNKQDPSNRLKIVRTINKKRDDYEKEKLINEEKIKSLSTFNKNKSRMEFLLTFFSKSYGNCYELSYATLNDIYIKDSEKQASIWYIPSDDHVLVIIDHNTPQAVFCDPLMGDVFPADEILSRLNTYYCFSTEKLIFNLYPKFNPNYHYLNELFSLKDLMELTPDPSFASYVTPYFKYKTNYLKDQKYINRPYQDGKTPLQHAVQRNDGHLIESLLTLRADPNISTKTGETPLIKASEMGSVKITQLLIKSKANIQKANNKGFSSLAYAAENGNLEIVRILLENKANPNQACYNGNTPIFFLNQKAILKELIKYKADINYQNQTGLSPLMKIVGLKNIELLKTLLEEKADPNLIDHAGRTALYLAAKNGNVEAVRILLSNPNIKPNEKNESGETAIYVAASEGHTDIIRILLEAKLEEKIDPNLRTNNGTTPLMIAIAEGYSDIVELLLQIENINLQSGENGLSPLFLATEAGNLNIIQMLLKRSHEIDPNTLVVTEEVNALLIAIARDYIEIVNLLLTATFKTKINVNQKSKLGGTALYLAAQKGQTDIVKLLLSLGANVDLLYDNQFTPIYVAAMHGHTKVIRVLAETKVDFNFPNEEGITPLIIAVEKGHMHVIKTLLDTGRVDVNKTMLANGCTALHIAIKKGRADIVDLLLQSNKINLNVHNKNGKSPLQSAFMNHQLNITKLLLSYKKKLSNEVKQPDVCLNPESEKNSKITLVKIATQENTPLQHLSALRIQPSQEDEEVNSRTKISLQR